VRRPDSILTTLRGFFSKLTQHRFASLGIVGVLVVIGLGVGLYSNHQEARTEAGRNELFRARQALNQALGALAPPQAAPAAGAPAKAAPPSTDYLKLDPDTQLAGPIQKLKDVAAAYAGTRAGFEATLTLGDTYFNHGAPAQAKPWYEKAEKAAPGLFERALAVYSLGYALENTGAYAEAVKTLERAINLGEPAVKGDALMALARCKELLKDTAGARAAYDQVISQFPNTELSRLAETLKAKFE
jgi:tetratricopeptide (TPR) repeat protein